MKFSMLKSLGYGIGLWVLMFVVISVFVAFKIYESQLLQIVGALIAGVISLIFAGILKPNKSLTALSYGLSWVIVGVILDYLVTKKFNAQIFSTWTLWLGYAFVLLAPLLKVKKSLTTFTSAPPTV